ncbi:8112_t:CDS:2 [Funneliformis geosporum]|nr:8112_t:CDS:2 [Funneliformis geosporum]
MKVLKYSWRRQKFSHLEIMEVEYLEDVKEQLDFQRYFNVLLPQDEDSLRMRQKSSGYDS